MVSIIKGFIATLLLSIHVLDNAYYNQDKIVILSCNVRGKMWTKNNKWFHRYTYTSHKLGSCIKNSWDFELSILDGRRLVSRYSLIDYSPNYDKEKYLINWKNRGEGVFGGCVSLFLATTKGSNPVGVIIYAELS